MGATIKSWTLYHKNTIMFDNYSIQKSDFSKKQSEQYEVMSSGKYTGIFLW